MRIKSWFFPIFAGACILLDQWTKNWIDQNFSHGESRPIIDGFFNLTSVRNPGVAFGFLGNAPEEFRKIFLLVVPILALALVVYLFIQTPKNNLLNRFALISILSGAIGNILDRIRLGEVIDFLDFYIGQHHYPAFNVADICITFGVGLLLLDSWRQTRKAKNAS